METGVIIQEPVSAMISEGAGEYLLNKQADETVRNDDIEGTPGPVDHSIRAHEVKIVPDESNGHNGSNGVTIDGENFSGSADAPEDPNGSGKKENEGAERANERAEREKEAATDNYSVVETPKIAKDTASEAEKEAGNSDGAFDEQVSNFVEAETTVHEPDMVSVAERLNRDDHVDNGKAQLTETISRINEERIVEDASVDNKTEDEMSRETEEMHESSKVIGEAVTTEKQTVQQELHSIEGSPIHVEEIVKSSEAPMDTPPVNIKEDMVTSCKEGEIEENSNQAHEESQTSSTNKDTEGHILEENMPKDETIVTETEAVDRTTAAEKECCRNAETIENEIVAVKTTAAAGEEIQRNAVTIVNETEAVDTTTAEEEEKISEKAETLLDPTEAVHTTRSTTAAEEKIPKYAQLLDQGETTKEGHLEPEENPTEQTRKEMLHTKGEETIKNETEGVQTTAAAEEEIPRNAETIVKETEAVDTTTEEEEEEEKISEKAETILDTTEAVHTTTAAEEKIAKDAEVLNEGETTKEGHLGPKENLTEENKDMLHKEGEETMKNETEAVQMTAVAEEEIPWNAETIVNETEAVDTTTAEELEKISKNAETILDTTEAVHTTTAAEEKIAKDAELLDEGETTKEGKETIENESETVQTTAAAEEEIPRNAETIVNKTEAVDTTTAEELEKISKNAEMVLDTTEAVHTTTAAEEKIAKDAELLDEGETTLEGHLEPEENLTEENRKDMLHKKGGETIANETEAIQTTAAAEEIPKNAGTAVHETEAVDTRTAEEKISKNAETDVDAIDTTPTTAAAEEKFSKNAKLLDEGETAKECNLESDENPIEENGEEMLHKEGEETKEDKELGPHMEEEREAEAIKTAILSEEAPKEVDKADDMEYIKDKITGKDTSAHEMDDEVKNLDQVSVQTAESGGYTEPSSSEIKDQTQEREESFEVNSKNLPDVTGRESQEKLEEMGQESQGSCERNEAATEIAVVTERSEGETQVCEQLLEKSSSEPERKILQEEESGTIQVTKDEGLELEQSPSGPLKVQTEDHGSEGKGKLTEESLKIDEVAETNIAPEVFIPSKDQVAEEADKTGESQITKERRGLAPGDLEEETNDQNETWPGASEETKDQETVKTDETLGKPVVVEGVGLGETTHDQTLPEVESIEQMEKASLEFPSEGLKQASKTVDKKIEENSEEVGILDQDGQEEGSAAVMTKEETCPPVESEELEERAQGEKSVDEPVPLEKESCLLKEQTDEIHSQNEQTEKHESPNEEIPDNQQVLEEEKSDELIKFPPALLSEEQELGTLAEFKKIEEEKAREAESAANRSQERCETTETPEPNGVPSLPVEVSEPDETPSSELVSELGEQTSKQVEEILEEERKEADKIKTEKVISDENISQEISDKQAPASALVSEEEEQATSSDAVTIQEPKGEDEVTERDESQKEFPNAAETEETIFPEEKQYGDQTRLQEPLLTLPSEESEMITTDTYEKLQDKPKEDEEGSQVLEPLTKHTDAADRGLPLEESSMPNEEIKASDEQMQIPSEVGDNENLEGSDLTKVTEATADQSFLEEKPDEHAESTLDIKQEEIPTEETKEGDKETERTVALEGSGISKTLEIRQEELLDLDAPKLEDTEEDKNQKSPESTEIPEAQADHCLPVKTSEPDQTPPSELVTGLDEQTLKQVEEIHEAKTKEADELQAGEIPRDETIPRDSSDDKGPTSVLASGEEEQATASHAVTMQESTSEDEVTKRNEGQGEGPGAVEIEDKIGDTKTKESQEEAKEKIECSDAEVTHTPADQSHIEEKSDDQVETPPYALLSLETQVHESSTEATKIEIEDTKKTNTGVTETLEGQSMSNSLENVCLNQEELKDLEAPKQGEITEDHTPLKGENPDDASYSNKTGKTVHGDGLSSTLPDVPTENECKITVETEREIRDTPSLGETMTMEPVEQTQKAGDAKLESHEKDFEPSIKPEDIETEVKHPVTEIIESATVEKQDMKEAEEAPAAETKEESSLQQDESRETEKPQERNGVEEQSLPANELSLQKHIEEVEIQEERTRELEANVEEKIQKEESRENVEREEEIPAGHSLSEESPSEKIQIPSSTLPSEEPEYRVSTEKQEGKTEESEMPKNGSGEDSRPKDMTETLADRNMPEETPNEQVQTQSTSLSTEKLVQMSQTEVTNAHEDGQKEGEEIEAKAQQDVTTAAVEKTCLQEEQPRDLEASKKVTDTSDQIIEAQKPAEQTEAVSSASPSRETEQKPDNLEPVEEYQSVDIKEEKKNEEMQDEKLEDPSPSRVKEEAFSPKGKRDHEDATEHGLHHDLTSIEIEKEKEPESALGDKEENNGAVSSEKQIIHTSELIEKSGGAEFESNEEIVELQARSDDSKSKKKHVTTDIGITGKEDEDKTEEASVAEAKKEECLQQEESKETDIFTAEKSTNDLDFPMEQAPKDQIEEVKMQEKQRKELEAHIEEIHADQSLTKEADIEQIRVPTSALPSKEQEHVTSAGNQNQVKEYEPALDESQEGSDPEKMAEILADQGFPEEKPGELVQVSEFPLEEQVQETSFEIRKAKEDENEEALAGTRDIDALTTKAKVCVEEQPQDFEAPRRDEDTSDQTCVAEESATQLIGISTSFPSDEQGPKSNDLSPLQEDKGTDTKVERNQEEPLAREERKETSLSEEKKELQDVIKHGVDHGLKPQTAEFMEVLQQPSSALASEDNKHEKIDTATEIEEQSKEELENIEKKNISEASDVSLTEPTIQSKDAIPKDVLTEVHGPTVALDNVLKIQALEMIERNEILQKEVAQEENNDASENADQISLPEVTKQIYREVKQTDTITAVTGDEEEKLSGGKEQISAEKKIEEPMFLLESLPTKADKVPVPDAKETAERNLDVTKGTDEVTKEREPEVQKMEMVSSNSLSHDAYSSKIEEQETETSQKEGCPSQPKEITEEVQKLGKTIPVILDKEILVEETLPQQKTAEDLQKNEEEADGAENINDSSSEVKETEHVEKKMNKSDEKMTEPPISRESARNSLSDLLHKVKEVKETKTGEEGTQVEKAKTGKNEDTEASHIEEAKTEEDKDEEEDEDEHKEDKTSPDSIVMVEARDLNVKTPHKKSHGILSGVGSKVKHSISKVKKAITGKSSHTKPISPE